MSNMKSKLAASVRQVKAQAPAPAKPAAPARKPSVAKQAAPAIKAKANTKVEVTTGGDEPQASGSALFPSRVWPD